MILNVSFFLRPRSCVTICWTGKLWLLIHVFCLFMHRKIIYSKTWSNTQLKLIFNNIIHASTEKWRIKYSQIRQQWIQFSFLFFQMFYLLFHAFAHKICKTMYIHLFFSFFACFIDREIDSNHSKLIIIYSNWWETWFIL